MEERLKSDLEAEYKAIRNYREHIARIDEENIQALLKRIILDEEVHVLLFKEALRKYVK
jgi:bacterioferritin